jgi:hypothetical protein|tara:strand:+ start:551 stop:853 length:303 start_codon:yes stop_codon:yes gene_type:complete
MFNLKKGESKMKTDTALIIDDESKMDLIPAIYYITYYAKKHSKIITRKGLKFKPDTETQGKYFVSKDETPCFIYWDCDAEPNENGNQWRQATGSISVKSA